MKKEHATRKNTLNRIHHRIFSAQVILIVTLAVFLGAASMVISLRDETQKRDLNLKNVATAIAQSPLLRPLPDNASDGTISQYLDSLHHSLTDIDVISVVRLSDRIRLYHSNSALIGTVYDGNVPDFSDASGNGYLAVNDSGPSGTQRRAYAAIYDADGNCVGFVMAIMLMKNIHAQTLQILLTVSLITAAAVLMELLISARISRSIRRQLKGYEPDVFSAMYSIRDNILESLSEGVIAADRNGVVQFINRAAAQMISPDAPESVCAGKSITEICGSDIFSRTLQTGEMEFNLAGSIGKGTDILMDLVPIVRDGDTVGAVSILHDRAEYTRLMEDLTGTRYLVDSMRANNHDFTNKLHVILGLIEMGLTEEAANYIENISFVERKTVSKIMSVIGDASLAALLIGKSARASELNIRFILRDGCGYNVSDCPLPSGVLVTIVGNLVDNAFEALDRNGPDNAREFIFGIYSRPGALMITADDTGEGISDENLDRIFDNGFSTKGTNRGTGLYQVKNLVDSLNGSIRVDSGEGIGTSFSVSFTTPDKGERKNV